jgi:hypothetical protein
MTRVTADDWADLRKVARAYCRTVDSSRLRKRMDGSSTVARSGFGAYGTDDVSDDTTQDAVLIFAKLLRKIITTCAASSVWLDSREIASWQYVRKRDGETMIVDRRKLHWWAVRHAAERNGYRLDVPPDEITETPGAQTMRAVPHAEHVVSVAVQTGVSQLSQAIFETAWGDGKDFPTLRDALFLASEADDLKREGILSTIAQARHGGAYGSRRIVRRTRDTGRREWQELSARLDQTHDDLVRHGLRAHGTE